MREQIIRHEANVMAPSADRAEHLEHPYRTTIPIRCGHAVIDHQNLSSRRRLDSMGVDDPRVWLRRLGMRGEAIAPATAELLLVHHLIRLDPGLHAPSACQSLVMDDLGQGLVDDLVTRLADLEGQVSVLVISRHVVAVEAAKSLEEGAWYHQAGPGAIIHLASEVVLGMVGVVELAVVPAAGVVPDHAPGLLKPAIGVDQLRTSEPGPGHVTKGLQERVQPAGSDDRVVVEKNEELAPARVAPRLQDPMKPRF